MSAAQRACPQAGPSPRQQGAALGKLAHKIAEVTAELDRDPEVKAIILRGKVGTAEFTAEFVASDDCQQMQGLIETRFDQAVEDMGWDKIRSRIDLFSSVGFALLRP